MPTCHDCEDEEYVDGRAISPATVYVAGLACAPIGTFSSTHALPHNYCVREDV